MSKRGQHRENLNRLTDFGQRSQGGEEMVSITVELIPGSVWSMRRSIAAAQISNISDLADISSYHVLATEGPNPLTLTLARSAELVLVGHNRRQSIWKLVEAVAAELQIADWEPI